MQNHIPSHENSTLHNILTNWNGFISLPDAFTAANLTKGLPYRSRYKLPALHDSNQFFEIVFRIKLKKKNNRDEWSINLCGCGKCPVIPLGAQQSQNFTTSCFSSISRYRDREARFQDNGLEPDSAFRG